MRKKAIVEIDEAGAIWGKNEVCIGNLCSGAYEPLEYIGDKKPLTVNALLSLKEVGYEVEDIFEMRSKGLI